MATGTGFTNQIIEKSRGSGARQVCYDYSAREALQVIGGTGNTYTGTRDAVGDYCLLRSAAAGAETDYLIFNLAKAGWKSSEAANAAKGEITRGFLPTTFRLFYGVGVVNATSITADLVKTTFGNGAAISVDSNDTIAVAQAATLTQHTSNRYTAIYTLTIDPTTFDGAEVPYVEIAVVLANTGTFRLYGASVTGTLLL